MFGESKSSAFNAIDTFLVLILFFISSCARLWTIAWPNQVVFDEVHFGNFTKFYVKGEFHFDIHPPLGKMMMAYISKLGQYHGELESICALGTKYKMNETQYISLRMIPAIFSSCCAPLVYCTSRLLYIDPFPSFAGALLVALDSSMIVESKFILSDGMLHFWFAFHLYTLALFLRHGSEWRAILAGFTLGAAGSCKFTALSLYAIDGISQIVWILVRWPSIISIIIRGCCLLIPSFISIILSWLWHFQSTPFRGYHHYYINSIDLNTLIDQSKINTSYWGNRIIDSPLLFRLYRWLIVMNRINMRSKIPHPWESRPQYWPLLLDKYVLFYSGPKDKRINCMGLPSSYWISSFSLFLAIPALFFRRAGWQNLFFIWSWAVSFVPFLGVPRTMFHYHYLLPLMCACLNTSALLHFLFGTEDQVVEEYESKAPDEALRQNQNHELFGEDEDKDIMVVDDEEINDFDVDLSKTEENISIQNTNSLLIQKICKSFRLKKIIRFINYRFPFLRNFKIFRFSGINALSKEAGAFCFNDKTNDYRKGRRYKHGTVTQSLSQKKNRLMIRSAVCMLIIIISLSCYSFFSPLIYGTSCPNCQKTRMWLSRWTYGPPLPVYDFGKQLFNTTERRQKLPL